MTAMFHHRSYRAVVMVRGALILLIYDHTLSLNISAPSKSDALTLINADIERIGSGLRSLHETWASILEIGLSLWLLDIKIGVSTVAAAMVVIGNICRTPNPLLLYLPLCWLHVETIAANHHVLSSLYPHQR